MARADKTSSWLQCRNLLRAWISWWELPLGGTILLRGNSGGVTSCVGGVCPVGAFTGGLCIQFIRHHCGLCVSGSLSELHMPTARDGSASCIDESRASFRRSGLQTHKRSDRDRRCGCVILASCLLGRRRRPDCRGSGPVKRPNGCHRAGQYPEKMRHSVRSGSGSSPLAFPHMRPRSTQSRSWVLFLTPGSAYQTSRPFTFLRDRSAP